MPRFTFDALYGSDSGAGTRAAPWKTVAKFNAERAAGTFGQPETVVEFRGGQTFDDAQLNLTGLTYTAQGRLTITTWGSGYALLKSSVNGRNCVAGSASANVLFKRLKFEHLQGAASDGVSSCVVMTSCTNVAFDDVETLGGAVGIASVASTLTLQRTTVRHAWVAGLLADANAMLLSDVELFGVGYDSAFTANGDTTLGMGLWSIGTGYFFGDQVRALKCRRTLRSDNVATHTLRRSWIKTERADQLDQVTTSVAATVILRDSLVRMTGTAPAPRWAFNLGSGATLRLTCCTVQSEDLYSGLFTLPAGAVYADNVSFVCKGTAQAIAWVGNGLTHQYRNCNYFAISTIIQPFLVGGVQKTIAQWLTLTPNTNCVSVDPGYVHPNRPGPDFSELVSTSPLIGAGLDLTGQYAGPLTDYFGFAREAPAPWSIGGYEYPVPTYQSFYETGSQAALDGLLDVDCFASRSSVPPFPGFPAIDHYVEATVTFTHGMKSVGLWALGGRAGSGTAPPLQPVSSAPYDYVFAGGAGRNLEDSGAWELGNTPGNDDPRRVRFELVASGNNGTSIDARIAVTTPGVLTLTSTTVGLSSAVAVTPGGSYALRLTAQYLGRTPNTTGGQDYLFTLRGAVNGVEVLVLTAVKLPQAYVEGIGIDGAVGPAIWSGLCGSRSRFNGAAPANATVAWTAFGGLITGDLSSLPSPTLSAGEARPKTYLARRDAAVNRLHGGGFDAFPRTPEPTTLAGVVPVLPSVATTPTPGTIPNLAAWLAASELAAADGQLLGTWTPVAGGVTPTAAGAGRPIFRTNRIHGHPAVEFDGVDDHFVCPGLGVNRTAMTFFAVYKVTGAPGGENPLLHSLKGGQIYQRQAHYLTCGGNSPEDFYAGDPSLGGKVWASENTGVLTAVMQNALYGAWTIHGHRGGAALVDVWRDGTSVGSATHPAPDVRDEDFKIGRGDSTSPGFRHFKGELAELLVYDRALSDAEVAAVHDYLQAKYAIAYTPTTPPPPPTVTYRDALVADTPDDAAYSFDVRDGNATLGRWRVSGVGGTLETAPVDAAGVPYPSYDGGNLLRIAFTERGTIELAQALDDVKPLRGRTLTAAFSGRKFVGRVRLDLLLRVDGVEVPLLTAYSTQCGDYSRHVATAPIGLNAAAVEFVLRATGEAGDAVGLSGAACALGDYRFDLPYRESDAERALPRGTVVLMTGAACPPGYRPLPDADGRYAFAATGDPNLIRRELVYDEAVAAPEHPYEVDAVLLVDASATQSGAAQQLTTLTWLGDLLNNRVSRLGLVRIGIVFSNRDYPGHVLLPLTPVTATTLANEFATALAALGSAATPPNFAGPGGDRMVQGLQAAKTLLEAGEGRVKMLFYNTDASFPHATLATAFADVTALPRFVEASAAVVNATLAATLAVGGGDVVYPTPSDAVPGILFDASGGAPGPDPAGAHLSAVGQGTYIARVFGDRIQAQVDVGLASRLRTPVSATVSRLGGQTKHHHAGGDYDGFEDPGDGVATTLVPLPARDTARIKPYPFGVDASVVRPEDPPALAVGVTHQHRYASTMEAVPPSFTVRFCEKL